MTRCPTQPPACWPRACAPRDQHDHTPPTVTRCRIAEPSLVRCTGPWATPPAPCSEVVETPSPHCRLRYRARRPLHAARTRRRSLRFSSGLSPPWAGEASLPSVRSRTWRGLCDRLPPTAEAGVELGGPDSRRVVLPQGEFRSSRDRRPSRHAHLLRCEPEPGPVDPLHAVDAECSSFPASDREVVSPVLVVDNGPADLEDGAMLGDHAASDPAAIALGERRRLHDEDQDSR